MLYAGSRGRRLFRHLKEEEDVVAFVDKSTDKIEKFYCGKRVISLDKYIPTEVIELIKENGYRTIE